MTSAGEFGSRHVKTVLMDTNKDIFTSAQQKGKWKWLAPTKQQQDTMEAEIKGLMQKRKLKIDGVLKETDVVKKQKIEEETKVLGKLMPQHLDRWWLLCSIVKSNEYLKLEMSRTWEPPNSWGC